MMSGAARFAQCGTPEQLEVLHDVEGDVAAEMQAHTERRKLWFPNDLIPADAEQTAEAEAEIARMRDAARGLPDTVRVAVALNLLTEEGLPHFHRLISTHLGNSRPWAAWNRLWTAEEDRHGCLLRDYVRDARLFDMGALERLQFQYIEAGFEPEWEQDPYRLLAYTSLQEKATQVSHANTGRLCASIEPMAQRVFAHIAGDESRHYQFYRAVFGAILKRDPERALNSLLKVMLGFAMPGHAISGYDDMSEVVRRAGIFCARQYRKIVDELLDFWQIGNLGSLSATARELQDKIMKVPARLARMADYQDAKAARRTFGFDFIYNRAITA
ncbi:acyl-[acyl-carrier-protein] desaturase [Solimonas aquatica]|uniref:Acyl-[acyl-carrier-protein] desaturase n=1 Tax=Solimonas aquatica TaxID=489703 RepID=A0A1H9JX01_9GAMM|nr:acyl-ACP desaturase [Solimonas aquatica]SEQ91273.1 acyl-[acyl-carrier-protein] desaturase [Solimonas aquatica]